MRFTLYPQIRRAWRDHAGVLMLLFASGLLIDAPAAVAGNLSDDNVGCASGQPCISNHFFVNNDLTIQWTADQKWDKYHIRWQRAGNPVHTTDWSGGKGGSYTIRNAHSGVTYTFAISGCVKHYVGKDRCSPWETQNIVAL